MKELIRFAAYGTATIAMIFVVIGIAQSGVSASTFAYSAIFIVVVLPVAISILMARREKRNA